MKRSPALQPLSREHHAALKLANACARAAQSGDAAMVSQTCQCASLAFVNELEPHFMIEEQTLLPMLKSRETQALVRRTIMDHEQLRGLRIGLQQNDVGALSNFAKYLTAHVRFEERELFPVIENML